MRLSVSPAYANTAIQKVVEVQDTPSGVLFDVAASGLGADETVHRVGALARPKVSMRAKFLPV
jgi:hypothetical protein